MIEWKTYKVADHDGMYVHVSVSGTVTFRYDYRLNGRRETGWIQPVVATPRFRR